MVVAAMVVIRVVVARVVLVVGRHGRIVIRSPDGRVRAVMAGNLRNRTNGRSGENLLPCNTSMRFGRSGQRPG
ncbi:MAG: hypothetical protein HY263_07365 [Chloroflexi bacterium]|nr:hypothetical protein [Chloroflexota bacterium]